MWCNTSWTFVSMCMYKYKAYGYTYKHSDIPPSVKAIASSYEMMAEMLPSVNAVLLMVLLWCLIFNEIKM